MKRLFGGATLLLAACCAHAGIISADFRTGAGYQLNGSDLLSNGGGWDSGEAWLAPDPAALTLTLQAHDHSGFQAFHLALATIDDPTVTGINFLTTPPAVDAAPIPEPATLTLFGLGAGALGLARQGRNKRA